MYYYRRHVCTNTFIAAAVSTIACIIVNAAARYIAASAGESGDMDGITTHIGLRLIGVITTPSLVTHPR